jgi:cytochrome P450
VIARLLGLPDEDCEQFHQWARTIVDPDAFEDPLLMAARDFATVSLTEYLREIVAHRRRAPGDDITTLLVESELDGERLEDEDIVSFLRLLLPAGAETTYRSSGNLLFALLSNPSQLRALRAHPGLASAAIEETVRWEPPIMSIGRVTTRSVELGALGLPAGAAVHVSLAAANHDESVFDRPDSFDLSRDAKPHLAFASGPHTCLGMQLARLEMGALMECVFDVLPDLRLAPGTGCHITGLGFREPTSLPVEWTA